MVGSLDHLIRLLLCAKCPVLVLPPPSVIPESRQGRAQAGRKEILHEKHLNEQNIIASKTL